MGNGLEVFNSWMINVLKHYGRVVSEREASMSIETVTVWQCRSETAHLSGSDAASQNNDPRSWRSYSSGWHGNRWTDTEDNTTGVCRLHSVDNRSPHQHNHGQRQVTPSRVQSQIFQFCLTMRNKALTSRVYLSVYSWAWSAVCLLTRALKS